ncbi:MAG: Ig-like domain-containing protein, partial [Deltaproteobacteria bacterium]|nr:Ig-like domain-containing protein [Deltaproteobacteria bacterium]
MKQNKKKALTSHFVVAIFVCIFLVFGCQEADDLSDASVQTADTTSPAIVTTSPENGATNVALNISSISATFSEKLDDSELSTSTIILQNGDQAIAGFSYCSNNSINLSPLSNLTGDKTYRVSISTDIKDTAGNSLAAGYSWAFSTGTEVD